MRCRLFMLLLGTAILRQATASADQTVGTSLRVTVSDATGGVIVGARVVVSQADREARETTTGERGTAVVTGLQPGPTEIHVESAGFEPRTTTGRRLRSGANSLEVSLQLARFAVAVEVSRDASDRQLDSRGDSFARVLGPDILAQLPDDPDEFERVIEQMAGPGATFRVNGFAAAKLPPKAQIRQIRFSLNTYAADVHGLGTPTVDIITQPGSETWHMSANTGFRTAALTARYPFAVAPSQEHAGRGGFTVDGPLWRNHTSMSLTIDASSSADTQTILASTPDGEVSGAVSRPTTRTGVSLLVEHALTRTHSARVEWARNSMRTDNLGVGGANLTERAYSSRQASQTLAVSDRGSFGRRLFNEFRAQFTWSEVAVESSTARPAVVVLDAFNAGGAQSDSVRKFWEVQVSDSLDFTHGRHAFRTGVLVESGRYRSIDRSNQLGTFTFSGLPAYQVGRPAIFTQRVGDPLVEYSLYRAGWFLQDEVRLHQSLTLGLGVRHEIQSQIGGAFDLAPRAGVTWAVRPDGSLLVRAGAGLVYNWYETSQFEPTLRVDGCHQYDIVVNDPGFPDPLQGEHAVALPPSRYLRAPGLRRPRVLSGSVSVQWQLAALTALTSTYTHQRGDRLFRGRNLNAPLPDGLRPLPELGNVIEVDSAGRSRLDRFDVILSRVGMRNGASLYMLAASYSLAWQMNDTDGAFSPPADGGNPAADWGPAASDERHRVNATAAVWLPKGFRLMTTMSFASAAPYNVTTGYDDNHDDIFNDRPAGVGRNSERGAGTIEVNARAGWTWGFGKPPGPSEIPNIRRRRSDLQRDPLGATAGGFGTRSARYRMELYAQASNLLNRVNPIGFRGVITSPYYGRATASLPPRRVEVGIRFDF